MRKNRTFKMRKNRTVKLVSVALAAWMFVAPAAAQALEFEPQAFRLPDGSDYPYTDRAADQSGYVSAADDLPVKWDSRDLGCVTSVKDQGRANCCWAFSSVAAMETSYVKQGYGAAASTDFSEAHLAWFSLRQRVTDTSDPTYGDGIMYNNPYIQGGEWRYMASALMRGSGMQLEKNAPWYLLKDEHATNYASLLYREMSQDESARYVSYARLWSAEEFTELTVNKPRAYERAKQSIMENGSVIMSYVHDYSSTDPYFNRANACYFKGQNVQNTNHSVLVIGWDDTFPKTNFNKVNNRYPSTDGAWLVKGSWGTAYGKNGFYWVSYAEPSILKMASVKAAPADTYTRIYQYDGSYPIGLFKADNNGSGMGNVFTAKQDELLTHVAYFNMNQSATDVTVEVYVPGGQTHYTERHDPTNGMRRVDEATVVMRDVGYGYFTAELAKPVPIHAGEQFFVFVSFSIKTNEQVIVPAEYFTVKEPVEGQMTYDGNSGESFVKIDGYWYDTSDMTKEHYDYNNVPVKAMTRDPDLFEPSVSVQTMPRKTQYRIGETFDPTGLSLLYFNAFGEQITLTEGFTCSSATFTQPGTYPITVTYGDVSCTFEVTADRMPGDADGDGVITTKDVALMRRVLAGWTGVQAYPANFDVNGDGQLTLVDVALVTRYLAGGYNVVLR